MLIFGIAFVICLFWLFLKDITDWMERRKAAQRKAELAANKYRPLEDEETGGDEAEEEEGKQASAADLTRELRAVTAECEMLEINAARYAKSTSDAALAVRAEIADRKARRDELRQIVHGVANAVKAPPKRAAPSSKAEAALAAIQQEAPVKEPSTINKIMKSALMKTIIRSAGGIMAISIYFADIISDVQVLTLLWDTKNYLWAFESLFLLIAQFLVVYLRVIPYLFATFGEDSSLTRTFLWFGFPTGLLLLDGLMFLEPFGLLSVLPFPEWLRQFVPAYKATRIIAEVVIESLPQCVLQAFIYVVVIKHTQAGTATASEAALFEFCSLLPKSILISVVAMVKTWIELVLAARQAGLSVSAKAVQLWQVGAGLPLDALKKGTILVFNCPHKLEEAEIPPLLDALGKNASLEHLDLSKSGVKWTAEALGSSLLETMNKTAASLAELKTFVVCRRIPREAFVADEDARARKQVDPEAGTPGYALPISNIRGQDGGMAVLLPLPLFTPDGMWREEILFMAELLRRNLNVQVIEPYEQATGTIVSKMLTEARKGKTKRDDYLSQMTKLIIDGCMRRGHLLALIDSGALRDVGFKAEELLNMAFLLPELRKGGFTASEMKAAKLKTPELRAGGYTAGQLKKGGFPVVQLKAAGFTAAELKAGGCVAWQLKQVQFSAEELKDNGFTAAELREGSFTAAQLKPLNYTTVSLSRSNCCLVPKRALALLALPVRLAAVPDGRLIS